MNRRRLSLLLALFFVALALPTSILVYQAYGQLKWEAFHQHQQLARELTLRIDAGFNELIAREETRPVTDYEFLNVTGTRGSAFLQRSPLSEFPLKSEVPGLLGYFQVDASGQLRTPTLPEHNAADYGISALELQQRRQQQGRILGILGENRLVGKSDLPASLAVDEAVAPAEEHAGDSPGLVVEMQAAGKALFGSDSDDQVQSAFDALSERSSIPSADSRVASEQVKDLKLEDSYQAAAAPVESREFEAKKQAEVKRSRKEKSNLPSRLDESLLQNSLPASIGEAELDLGTQLSKQQAIQIQTFESEVEAMEFSLLDSGHFVLFRRAWHENERYIQGLLIEQDAFVEQLIATAFEQSSLSTMTRLIVAYRGVILRNFSGDYSSLYRPAGGQVDNELLYQSRMIAPFDDIELIYTLARLPIGAGGQVIIWSALVLALVLIGGCLMLYRLGMRQIALARQQQDFVSAVSHELKTPLTSIRMYGEMLRQGWADEEKRQGYYDFIFHESERLTRLINNVLQLARMSRNEQVSNLKPVSVIAALAELKPRLQSQMEPSGFELSIEGEAQAEQRSITIDIDWFIQIFTNLVDNAVKFSAAAENKRIDIRYRLLQDDRIQFSVRDYGPGIASDQMKKIFTLFYRSENELTRETVGTGIGLALVHQLANAMQAEVDVVSCDPGAEFRIVMQLT